MSDPTVPADIAEMSFEDALAELEGIVRRLEGGQVRLDDAIQSYERGAQLKRHCEQKLSEAQQRVDRIVVASDGSVSATQAKLD
ncbi:MAG TPA: exodeoxyribonuclease VII small subunit [Stellaceae bacterium]|nr:exodeoxyribonuclease VII small subunit [Stellaceae bacterium]